MVDRSLAGGYAAIGAIFHTDPFAVGEPWATEEGKWMDGTLEYAAKNNVPIWSGEMWLNFVESRHDASVENIHWDMNTKILSFTTKTHNLRFGNITMLLPTEHSRSVLSGLEVNGQIAKYDKQVLGSTSYACFSLRPETAKIIAYFV
jgi:hypothetical protein